MNETTKCGEHADIQGEGRGDCSIDDLKRLTHFCQLISNKFNKYQNDFWLDCLARMGVTREWMANWNWCSPSRIWTNLQVGLVHPCRLKSWHTGRVSSNCKYNNTFISIIVVTQFQCSHSPAASTLLASALWYKVSNYSKCNLGSFVIS